MLVGLVGVTVSQPVLDLMGQNPEFFVAGGYSASQIVAFGFIVALGPSLIVAGTYLGCRAVDRRVGEIALVVLVGALGVLFGCVLARGLGLERIMSFLGAAVVCGGLAVLFSRTRAGGLLLQYLAGMNLLFLVSFLVLSPTSELLGDVPGAESMGEISVPEPPGPVVVVVLDALPISTIMQSDGSINEARYPSFARLASGSTWYRNASTVHDQTVHAVPAILTGRIRESEEMPTFRDLPRNLLALFSRSMPVVRYEAVTDLCPPEACTARARRSVVDAVRDSALVYGHRTLPAAMRDRLDPIDERWGDFGADVAAIGSAEDVFSDSDPLARFRAFGATEQEAFTQNLRLVEVGLQIDGTPGLYFAHVVTPHRPWSTTPWGTRLFDPQWPGMVNEPGEDGFEWSLITQYQRHSLQAGAADAALGQVLDQIESSGSWSDATVVVVADHGRSFLGPDVGRSGTDANRDEVYRVPLFIKAPGQTAAAVVDAPAQTLDVLPTLINLLGIETDWELDGIDLTRDSGGRTRDLRVGTELAPLLDVVRAHEAQFPTGNDWDSLFAVGEHASLVGRPLSDFRIGGPSSTEAEVANLDAYDSLPMEDGTIPYIVRGVLRSADESPPPSLVVAVNGSIAGATGTYGQRSGGWSFSATIGDHFDKGQNVVELFEVTATPDAAMLHPVALYPG